MSAEAVARIRDPAWRATAASGVALVGGAALVLASHASHRPALALVMVGVILAAYVLLPPAAAAVQRQPAVLVVALVALLGLAWVLVDVVGPGQPLVSVVAATGLPVPEVRRSLVPLMLITLATTGGLVLISDTLSTRLRRRPMAPWEHLTTPSAPSRLPPWRAIAGVLLVGWAALMAIGLVGPYVSGRPTLQLLAPMLVVVAAAVVVGAPVLVGALAREDRDRADRSLEEERQRFAAHLHDSVLQTLALVQRQAHDPAAVTRLARRQEQALRAWMAGEGELVSETLGAALRDVIAEVEDEHGLTIEHSIIGDRPLDAAGEALAAATREALRNAARHASAPVFAFAELSRARAEVFVRDEGGGFSLDTVPTERRGIRDAIIGRMASVGGGAVIDSVAGEGTEVALTIGAAR